MIGRLRGTLVEKRAPWLIIELADGLGYELEASMSTFYRLPEVGETLTLYTHQVVREDAHLLYGFIDFNERSLFRTLIKVNGVGPKLGLTILSGLEPAAFVECINNNDVAMLVRVPGIGKKTAERLIVEMRDRLSDQLTEQADTGGAVLKSSQPQSVQQEAISALIALGYKPQDASRMMANINDDTLTVEQMIKQALQGMMA